MNQTNTSPGHEGAEKTAADHIQPYYPSGKNTNPSTMLPGVDGTPALDLEQRALAEGTTVAKLQEEHAIRANPPSHLAAALRHTAKLEAQLAQAREAEDAQVQIAAEHERLVVNVERAMKAVNRLKERLQFAEESLTLPGNIEARCELMACDDMYSTAKEQMTYATLAGLRVQRDELVIGIPLMEKKVSEARAALEAFQKQHGIRLG